MNIREGPGGGGVGTMPFENTSSSSAPALEGSGGFSAEGWHGRQREGTLVLAMTSKLPDGEF